jgi:2-methylcitrate dehydratase PrpD
MLAAKFSLPFSLATMIVNGTASIAAFRDAARSNAVTRDLARRVFVREDLELTACLPALRPARVAVTLTDGRLLKAEVLTNKGDTEDPYSSHEIRDKFMQVAGSVWAADHCQAILVAAGALDALPDIRDFTTLLTAELSAS